MHPFLNSLFEVLQTPELTYAYHPKLKVFVHAIKIRKCIEYQLKTDNPLTTYQSMHGILIPMANKTQKVVEGVGGTKFEAGIRWLKLVQQ